MKTTIEIDFTPASDHQKEVFAEVLSTFLKAIKEGCESANKKNRISIHFEHDKDEK